ncbi:MAG: alpha/beta hydrolase [Bacillota bacterium]
MSEKGIRESEGRLTGKGGVDLYYRSLVPSGGAGAGGPRAVLAVAHGAGEHSGRYVAFARRYADRGFAVYALDFRGLGQSGGRRGHVGSFSEFLDDYDALLGVARRENPGLPVVAYGHSMGGLIVLLHGVEGRPGVGAVIASGPAVALGVKVPPAKLALARVAGRLMPTFSQENEIDPSLLARNPEVGRAYAADPLVCRVVSAGWFLAFNAAVQKVSTGAASFVRPCLILQGTADKLVDPAASRAFFEQAGSADKTYHPYDGFYHELHNEDERETVLADVDRWLEERLARLPR